MRFFKFLGRKIANGFHFFWYCIIYAFGKIFMRSKVINKENINKDDEAQVFICNHLELYGPVITHLRFPVKKKAVWIHEYMLDKDKIEEQMAYGFVEFQFKWIPKFIKRGIVKLLKHLVIYVFKNKANGIPVSRESASALITTLQNSVEKINEGNSILIFPELDYKETGIGKLAGGFTTLAKYVYKKTKKRVSFYPVYINKKKKQMCIGKPITYNPEDDNYSQNIVNYITTEINKMSE